MITTSDDVQREMTTIASGKASTTQLEDALAERILAMPPAVIAKLPPAAHAVIERFVARAGVSSASPAEALKSAKAYFKRHPVDPQLAARIARAFGQLAVANVGDDRARRARAFLGG